jgi:predicted nucleic acid-binding protein
MLGGFRIAALDPGAIDAAYESELPDFEDALQFAAAQEAKVDAIVTRNKKHFRQPLIPLWSPEEAVDAIREA